MSLNKGRRRVLELEVEKLKLESERLKEEVKHLKDRLRLFETLQDDQNRELIGELDRLKKEIRGLYCLKKPWWRR